MSDDTPRRKIDRRPFGICEECGEHRRLNPIPASHSADVLLRLCDECAEKRRAALEAMYRGD